MFQLMHKVRQCTSSISAIYEFGRDYERLSEKALGNKKTEYFHILSNIKNCQSI